MSGHTAPGTARWGKSGNCQDYGSSAPAPRPTTSRRRRGRVLLPQRSEANLQLLRRFPGEPTLGQGHCKRAHQWRQLRRQGQYRRGNPRHSHYGRIPVGRQDELVLGRHRSEQPAAGQTMDVSFNGFIQDGISNLDDGLSIDDVTVSCVSSCPIKETYRQRPTRAMTPTAMATASTSAIILPDGNDEADAPMPHAGRTGATPIRQEERTAMTMERAPAWTTLGVLFGAGLTGAALGGLVPGAPGPPQAVEAAATRPAAQPVPTSGRWGPWTCPTA